MKSVLIGLLMLITHAQFSTSCPASCVVCSEDAIICHKLSNVIEVPNTTKILMLTDGQIQLINNSTLSILSNITVLGLSGNIISNIMENAFHNLTLLKTLLLDHNHISSLSILNSTFTQLQNLEVLQLGHNAIQNINRNWFQGLRSLLVLHLEGNLITRLPADTFQSSNLENLETLDLSDNLIESLSKGSFYGLPRLRNLDLSRNSLRSAPDAFSYLSWLSALNLDLNEWNCTCELWELSSFLSSYIQAPDKVLYNGRQMVCLSTANPAVQTVLQLTEANCVPPNQNITVLVKAGNSISMNHYARDISLAAFFFFFGGVGITMIIIYIIYSKSWLTTSMRPWRDWNCDEVEEEIQNQASPQCSFTGDNDVQILTITHPGHQAKLMLPNSKEQAKPRVWLGERGLANSRAARTERYFSCHQCSPQGTDPVSMKYSSAADPSRTTVLQNLSQTLPYTQSRFTVMDEKRRPVAQPLLKSNADFRIQSHYQRSIGLQHSLHSGENSVLTCQHLNATGRSERSENQMGHSSIYQKHTQFQAQQKTESRASESLRNDNGLRPEVQSVETLPECLILTCVHCQRAYKYILEVSKASSGTEEIRTKDNAKDMQTPTKLATRLYRKVNMNTLNAHEQMRNHNGMYLQKKAGIQRNVTFNLTESDMDVVTAQKSVLRDEEMWNGSEKALKSDKRMKLAPKSRHKHKGQLSGLLKVKIDLNPFKKSRVHPNDKELSKENTFQKSVKNKKMRTGDWNTDALVTRDNNTLSKEQMKKRKKSKGQSDEEKMVSQTQSRRKPHDLTLHLKTSTSNNSANMDKIQDSIKQPVSEEPTDCEQNEIKVPKVNRELESKQGQNTFLENDAEKSKTNKSEGIEDTSTSGGYSAESEKVAFLSDILTLSTTENQNECLELKENGDKLNSQEGIPLEFFPEPSKSGVETDQHINIEGNHCHCLSSGLKRTASNSSQLQSINNPNDVSPIGGEKVVHEFSNVYPSQSLKLTSLHQGENIGNGVIQETGQSANTGSATPIIHEMKDASISSFKNENTVDDGGLPSSSRGTNFQTPQGSPAFPVLQANSTELLTPPGQDSTTCPHNEEAPSSSHLFKDSQNGENISNNNSMDLATLGILLQEEQVPSASPESSPKRKLCLILPEKSNRPKTALEKKIR